MMGLEIVRAGGPLQLPARQNPTAVPRLPRTNTADAFGAVRPFPHRLSFCVRSTFRQPARARRYYISSQLLGVETERVIITRRKLNGPGAQSSRARVGLMAERATPIIVYRDFNDTRRARVLYRNDNIINAGTRVTVLRPGKVASL